jgi:hypothetical protein
VIDGDDSSSDDDDIQSRSSSRSRSSSSDESDQDQSSSSDDENDQDQSSSSDDESDQNQSSSSDDEKDQDQRSNSDSDDERDQGLVVGDDPIDEKIQLDEEQKIESNVKIGVNIETIPTNSSEIVPIFALTEYLNFPKFELDPEYSNDQIELSDIELEIPQYDSDQPCQLGAK